MKTNSVNRQGNAETQRPLRFAEKKGLCLLRVSPRPPRLCVKVLFASLRLSAVVLILLPLCLPAATNDLTSALQRGLFEEEANHNLEAAAQAYQAVSTQFDKDRKLAATAIFRLGEVYRKQGKTNEATAQYERIVREFSDQQTLATLSRQNLAGIGSAAATTSLSPTLTGGVAMSLDGLQSQYALLKAQLEQARKETNDDVVAKLFNDEELRQAVANVTHKKQALNSVRGSNSSNPPAVKLWEGELRGAEQALETFRKRLFDYQELRLNILQSAIQKARDGQTVGLSASIEGGTTQPIDDEEKEIRRVQAMIQNSPDLINGPGGGGLTPLCQAASKGQMRVATFLLGHGADINANSPLRSAAARGQKAMVELLLGRGADVNAASSDGRTALHLAAENGFLSVTEALLAAKADPNLRDIQSQTPLTLTAKAGFLSVAGALLAHGADPDVVSKVQPGYGTNPVAEGRAMFGAPLHFAAARGDAAMTALLLTNRADVNVRSIYDETPLAIAAALGKSKVAELLLAAGADANARGSDQAPSPLWLAVAGGHRDLVKLLLDRGADPNVPTLSGTRGITPLMLAASNGADDIATLLLEHKADPNLKDGSGQTALLRALERKSVTVVKTLLAHGADPNSPDAEGNAPLWVAVARQRDKYLVAALLEAKAKVNGPNRGGYTALNTAANYGDVDLLKLLVAAGADVNARAPDGTTPLHSAVNQQRKEAVEWLLLAAKADPNATTRNGASALHLAVSLGLREIIETLLANGAEVNVKNENGETPLHWAVSNHRTDIVELLLSKSADPNVRNQQGQTPLDLAMQPARPGGGVSLPGIPLPGRPIGPAPLPASESKPTALAALLRQHGALDDLPAFDRIQVKRPTASFSKTIFSRGTNDGTQVSLLDLIGVQYQFLADSPQGGSGDSGPALTLAANGRLSGGLSFPDWAHLRIRRPAADGKSWQEQVVDVSALLESGDCSKNLPLQWGDEVVIPETDHPLNEGWPGFSRTELKSLKQCLTRSVEVIVKGQSMKINVSPKIDNLDGQIGAQTVVTKAPIWIQPVLRSSNLLLSSSDLSRVKVTRRDAASGGQAREWILDCSRPESAPAFWLRDGDVIEVPDKL